MNVTKQHRYWEAGPCVHGCTLIENTDRMSINIISFLFNFIFDIIEWCSQITISFVTSFCWRGKQFNLQSNEFFSPHFLQGIKWNCSQRIFTHNLHNSTTTNGVELNSELRRDTHSSLYITPHLFFISNLNFLPFLTREASVWNLISEKQRWLKQNTFCPKGIKGKLEAPAQGVFM